MEEFDNIIKEIASKTGLKESDILEKVYEKQEQYENLISDIGAAYLVAKDLGVKIESESKSSKEIKVKDIFPGINNIRVKVKILRIFPPTTFKREDGEGKVMNVIVGDETGTCRLVLWDEQVEEFKFVEGDVIEIFNGYTRERKDGGVEIRLGMYGVVRKIEGDIEVKNDINIKKYISKTIAEVREGESVVLSAYISKIFFRDPLVYFCRECGKNVSTSQCTLHGEIDPFVVVSGVLEDETSSIFFTLYDTALERFLNLDKKHFIDIITTKGIDHFYQTLNLVLGHRYIVKGNVKRNKYNDELELIINELKEEDVDRKISTLIEEIEEGVENVGD